MTAPRDNYHYDDDDDYYESVEPALGQDVPVVRPVEPEPDPSIPAVQPFRRGLAILAWPVILGLVAFAVARPYFLEAGPNDKAIVDRISGVLMQMLTRYALGASKMMGQADLKHSLFTQLEMYSGGSVWQRLRFAVVTGEFKGWEQALDQLDDLDSDLQAHQHQTTQQEEQVRDALTSLYSDYADKKLDAPSVTPAERAAIKKELGWFGELALAPEGGPDRQAREAILMTAQRTFIAILVAVALVGLLGLFGLIGLVVFFAMMVQGTLRGGLRTGSHHGGVYAETFALFMLLFFGFGMGVGSLQVAKEHELWVEGFAALGSLVALLWPLLRGIPLATMCQDIGLTWGRQPLAEPFIGIGCYAMGLPLLAVGFILTFILMGVNEAIELQLRGPQESGPFDPVLNSPAHPVIEYLAGGDWMARLQVLFVASFCAPVVEEIMFRGVLYRHVREATHGWGRVLSIGFSALWVSFIFAIIHPQGWVAVPALMSLAIAFTLAREWRRTLIPGIVAHGVHNGMLMTFVMLAAGN
jgi:membrane protease YdiL (CAAX protease family)